MFPLNTYKFQFQKGISVDKVSLINQTFKSRECHGQKKIKKEKKEKVFIYLFIFFTNMFSQTFAFNFSIPATL